MRTPITGACESPINKIFKNYYGKNSYHDKRINCFNIHQIQIIDFCIKRPPKNQNQTNECVLFDKKMEGKEEKQDKLEQNIEVDIRISTSKEEHKIS